MSPIWIFFDDGSNYAVDCRFYPPTEKALISGHFVNSKIYCVDFAVASNDAAHAAYWALESLGFDPPRKQAGFSIINLNEDNTDSSIFGRSCGLAFATAYAAAFFKKKTKKTELKSSFELSDIAAIGVIDDHGKISKVKGLEAKLKSAASILEKNGYVFYPQKNDYALPESLTSRFREKNIQVIPVENLSEVFVILFEKQINRAGKETISGLIRINLNQVFSFLFRRKLWKLWAVLITIVFLFYGGATLLKIFDILPWPSKPKPEQISIEYWKGNLK